MTPKSRLKFIADMNISPLSVDVLCREGYDVVRVNRILSPSAPDEDILSCARDGNYVLITEDMDFSALLAVNGYERPSVLSLRLSISDPKTVAERLLHVLPLCDAALTSGSVISVEDSVIRTRRLPLI